MIKKIYTEIHCIWFLTPGFVFFKSLDRYTLSNLQDYRYRTQIHVVIDVTQKCCKYRYIYINNYQFKKWPLKVMELSCCKFWIENLQHDRIHNFLALVSPDIRTRGTYSPSMTVENILITLIYWFKNSRYEENSKIHIEYKTLIIKHIYFNSLKWTNDWIKWSNI